MLFKNLRTASQGQQQIAKAEKSTEYRIVLFPPDIPAEQLYICCGDNYRWEESWVPVEVLNWETWISILKKA